MNITLCHDYNEKIVGICGHHGYVYIRLFFKIPLHKIKLMCSQVDARVHVSDLVPVNVDQVRHGSCQCGSGKTWFLSMWIR